MKSKQKNSKQGFTLLELLVVVLIIGVLAAIALPQYQMAVGKAKYAEIKAVTQSIATSLQNYYLIHGNYGEDILDDLDITIPNTISCEHFHKDDHRIRCCKQIFNTKTCFYRQAMTGRPLLCLVHSTDMTDKANRLCQKETGSKNHFGQGNTWTQYSY